VSAVILLLIHGLILGAVYGVIAVSFSLVYSTCRVLNFAQGDFVATGGVLFAILAVNHGWNMALAIVVAVVAVTVIAFLTVRLLIMPIMPSAQMQHAESESNRLRWVLATFGVGLILEALTEPHVPLGFIAVQPFIAGSFTWVGAPVRQYDLLLGAVSFLFLIAVAVWARRSSQGRLLRVVATDGYAARVLGLNVNLIIIGSFCVGGAVSALVGAFATPLLDANPSAGFSLALTGFVAATVGGLGDLRGALIGGPLVGVIQLFATRYITSQLDSVYPLILLLIVLMFRPQGILRSPFVERV
jgi:branched-chain amino acid transport system permease protein